jgi:transcriptional regulator with XRE-family HTH domain
MARTKEATELDRQIGTRLRMLRIARGKSQEWLGAQLGITFQQVQKYEKGINRIGGSRIQQIASALGVTPAYFFGEAAASMIRMRSPKRKPSASALRNLAEAMVSVSAQAMQ